jgi:hypothetical protein
MLLTNNQIKFNNSQSRASFHDLETFRNRNTTWYVGLIILTIPLLSATKRMFQVLVVLLEFLYPLFVHLFANLLVKDFVSDRTLSRSIDNKRTQFLFNERCSRSFFKLCVKLDQFGLFFVSCLRLFLGALSKVKSVCRPVLAIFLFNSLEIVEVSPNCHQ